jgi:hypothetical protein
VRDDRLDPCSVKSGHAVAYSSRLVRRLKRAR